MKGGHLNDTIIAKPMDTNWAIYFESLQALGMKENGKKQRESCFCNLKK